MWISLTTGRALRSTSNQSRNISRFFSGSSQSSNSDLRFPNQIRSRFRDSSPVSHDGWAPLPQSRVWPDRQSRRGRGRFFDRTRPARPTKVHDSYAKLRRTCGSCSNKLTELHSNGISSRYVTRAPRYTRKLLLITAGPIVAHWIYAIIAPYNYLSRQTLRADRSPAFASARATAVA